MYIFPFLFSEQNTYISYTAIYCIYGASEKEKGNEGKNKEKGAKIKREGKFDTGVGASRVSRNEGNFTLRKEG